MVSPANKTTVEGRQRCLDQRRAAATSGANLVEIDLVLQGSPLIEYTREGLPEWHYAVTVTRASQPQRHEIYTATLQKRLPRFRLPLAQDDRDTVLDCQTAFSRCYDDGRFFDHLDYCREPPASLSEENRRWLDALLVEKRLRRPLSPEEVALAAYYLWEGEGRPHGRDRQHWHQAQALLRRPQPG